MSPVFAVPAAPGACRPTPGRYWKMRISTTKTQTNRPTMARTWLRSTAPIPTPSVAESADIEVRDGTTGEATRLESGGLFIFIVADAETAWLPPEIAVDRNGYVLTGSDARSAGRWASTPASSRAAMFDSAQSSVLRRQSARAAWRSPSCSSHLKEAEDADRQWRRWCAAEHEAVDRSPARQKVGMSERAGMSLEVRAECRRDRAKFRPLSAARTR